MAGQPEDEAISIALHVGDTCVTTVAKVLEILLRAAESYKQARYARTDRPQRGVLGSAAHAAGSAVKDAVDKRVDGYGTVGFVKNSALGDDVTFIDASDVFDSTEAGGLTAEGRKQWNALRKALVENGIGVSISRGVPGTGKIRIGVSAKNAHLLADGLLRAGIKLTEDGVIDRGEAPSVDEAVSGERKSSGIPRDDQGRYPKTFRFAGMEFTASETDADTWVASDARDPRRHIVIHDAGDDSATWRIERNGREFASGATTPLGDIAHDPRIRCFKQGRPIEVFDPQIGERVPVWRTDPDGNVVTDEKGEPVPAFERIWCSPDDPDAVGYEVRAGVDDASISREGYPLESAIIDAAAKMELISIPEDVRASVQQHVSDLSTAQERLGKGSGGESPRDDAPSASQGSKKSSKEKPTPTEQAARANEIASKTVREDGPRPPRPDHGSRR